MPQVYGVSAGLRRRVRRAFTRARRYYARQRKMTIQRGVNPKYASTMKPVMFSNSFEVTLLGNATGTLGTGYGRNFKFDDITDVTDIMGLYDLYQIQKIEVRFIPFYTSANNSAIVNAPMYVVVDPTSSAAPTSAAEMLNYASVKTKQVTRPWSMTFVPSFFQSIGVVSSNEYCSKKANNFWLTNTDTVAYGLRIWVDPLNSNSGPIGTFIYTYHILAKFQS